MLAAYEAAIGPALRAIAGVVVPPSEKAKRGFKKNKVDKKSNQGKGNVKPPPRQITAIANGPRSHYENHHSTTGHMGPFQQPVSEYPGTIYATPQASYAPPPPQTLHDPATFERLERQALRTRKVEALESLAHTAALMLAEFMDFRQSQAAAAASSSTTTNATDGPSPQVDPGEGSAYAAAAAGMAGMAANAFQPPAGAHGWDGQHDGAGEERSGRHSDDQSSASDSDDDGDIPARVTQSNADEEYDSETSSEESVNDELRAGGEKELDVKVEDD